MKKFKLNSKWWNERFVTLMVIPERTQRVHKLVLPFFLLKLSVLLFSLGTVFLILIGMDYLHVLGRMAENKRLKGENFKLRQDLQLIRNKVDSMETTIERVRNYAKKLQMLTDQGEKAPGGQMPWGPVEFSDLSDEFSPRGPASTPAPSKVKKAGRAKKEAELLKDRSAVLDGPDMPLPSEEGADATERSLNTSLSLSDRVEKLQTVSLTTESHLSQLQMFVQAQSALMKAAPSLLPISGWLSSPFGYRRHPYGGTYRLHAGVDIAAEPGTPVRVSGNGTVIYSGYREGYGKVIVVDHGYGLRTVYAHSARLFVNAGDRVQRGDKIAEVGSTGRSTGPHLHFEIRKNGIPVNPSTFLTSTRF